MLTFCLGIVVHSGLWPCGDNHTFSCIFDGCGNGAIMANAALSSSLSISASLSKATATTTVTIHSSSAPQPDAGASTGEVAAVGAGIGVPLFIALLAALALPYRERRQRRALVAQQVDKIHLPSRSLIAGQNEGFRGTNNGYSLANQQHELGSESARELDGAQRYQVPS